jgi:hypothetical protein
MIEPTSKTVVIPAGRLLPHIPDVAPLFAEAHRATVDELAGVLARAWAEADEPSMAQDATYRAMAEAALDWFEDSE